MARWIFTRVCSADRHTYTHKPPVRLKGCRSIGAKAYGFKPPSSCSLSTSDQWGPSGTRCFPVLPHSRPAPVAGNTSSRNLSFN